MASNVAEMIDMLYDMVDDAKNLPLSSEKCVLDRDEILNLVDDIRKQFPGELAEAQKIVARRDEMIESAKREVEVLRQTAEERARQLVAESTINLQAKQRANEMMRQSEERSRELKRAANEYCEDALRRTEEAVSEAYDEIKQSHARFRVAANAVINGTGNNAQAGSRPMYDAAADEVK